MTQLLFKKPTYMIFILTKKQKGFWGSLTYNQPQPTSTEMKNSRKQKQAGVYSQGSLGLSSDCLSFVFAQLSSSRDVMNCSMVGCSFQWIFNDFSKVCKCWNTIIESESFWFTRFTHLFASDSSKPGPAAFSSLNTTWRSTCQSVGNYPKNFLLKNFSLIY